MEIFVTWDDMDRLVEKLRQCYQCAIGLESKNTEGSRNDLLENLEFALGICQSLKDNHYEMRRPPSYDEIMAARYK